MQGSHVRVMPGQPKGDKLDSFERAFAYTVGNEGSYSNDAHDSGGPTKYGITIHDLSVFLGRPASIQEVKDMTLDTAHTIYKTRYWNPLGCNNIKCPEVAICMFDIGVVRGIGVPPGYAQTICNDHGASLVLDGVIGPKTIAAINLVEPSIFIKQFASLAEAGFRAIVSRNPSQGVFLKGWVNRARRLLTLVSTLEKTMDATPTKPADTYAPWLDIAKSKLGEHELPGNQDNPFILECFKHTTFHASHDETAWCAAFVCYCLEVAGLSSTKSAAAISYKNYGKSCELVPGAILVFQWTSGEHHVTLLDHVVDANHVACIGGNQSNQVKYSVYPKSAIIATRWPA